MPRSVARILPTGEESNPVDSESTELTQEYLASVGADLEAVGLSTRQLVRHGEPAKAIGALAQELNVAALAIGGPDRGDSGSKTLGQIALGIIRRSDVPVLIA